MAKTLLKTAFLTTALLQNALLNTFAYFIYISHEVGIAWMSQKSRFRKNTIQMISQTTAEYK